MNCSWVVCAAQEGSCDAGAAWCLGDRAPGVELCSLGAGSDAFAPFQIGTGRARDMELALDESLDLPEGYVCRAA